MVATEGRKVQLLSELFNPHPKQMEYLLATDRHKYTLFGGARGPGKSYTERWRHVRFLLKLTKLGLSGVQTGLFSTTYKESRKRQFLPCKAEFPEWLGKPNEGNLEFNFFPEYGGHRIAFLNLEDPSQYKSDQFATIGIEEVTLCPNPAEIMDILSGSLRWPGVEWSPMGLTTNPDGPGHSQVKGMFVEKSVFSLPDFSKKNPDDYAFVRALPTDNPSLPKSYIEQVLEKLPLSLRKPWLEGSWDLFQGQRFFLNPRFHVIRPRDLGFNVKYYASIDYGFDNPFACNIYAVIPKVAGEPYIYQIAEINERGLDARSQAKTVIKWLNDNGITLASPAYLDTACWKQENDGLSIALKFQQEGLPVQQVLKDRATGWTHVEDLLSHVSDGVEIISEPAIKFFDTCPLTVQQLTDAIWDPKHPGDICHPEGFRDDHIDCLRYFALTHFKAPTEEAPPDRFSYDKRVEKIMKRIRRR